MIVKQMSEKKEPGGLYTAGYHGTSVEQAMRIVEIGFDTTASSVVFSPTDDMWAAAHRAIRASVGQREFAVVEATFPSVPVVHTLDGEQLILPPEILADVEVVRIMAWQMQANSGIPPRQLFPEHLREFREWWLD